MLSQKIQSAIRTVADWPKPGIMFRDITPLFQNHDARKAVFEAFIERYDKMNVDIIAGIDARGFLLGVTVAHHLGIPFVPIRKKGKLPFETISEDYTLEYGMASVEIHVDACTHNDRIVLFDDLIATGGTMLAAGKLLRRLGGVIVEAAAVIDLPDLGGSKLLKDNGIETYALVEFPGH
ncbi:MAG: adenine phosphoribosyltransferase [Spirochaetia bacterium]|nr:adenine phosphoribosyltransferase [Spirochaetia bacterium]